MWQLDPWVTLWSMEPMPLEEEHCTVVEVTEEEVQNSVKFVPSLSAVVRSRTMHVCQEKNSWPDASLVYPKI